MLHHDDHCLISRLYSAGNCPLAFARRPPNSQLMLSNDGILPVSSTFTTPSRSHPLMLSKRIHMRAERRSRCRRESGPDIIRPGKWVRENGESKGRGQINYEQQQYIHINQMKKYVNKEEVQGMKCVKWIEMNKTASFYIIMYFFTYNLKYESLPLGGSDLNFFI